MFSDGALTLRTLKLWSTLEISGVLLEFADAIGWKVRLLGLPHVQHLANLPLVPHCSLPAFWEASSTPHLLTSLQPCTSASTISGLLWCSDTWQLLPSLQLVLLEKVWTAIVPDEPYRVKGLCQEGNFPLTPCTFATAPPPLLIPPASSFIVLTFGAIFTKTAHSPCSSFASSASAYSGLLFLLDNPWLSHDLAEFCVCTKTDSSSVTHCKVYINSITKAKCPIHSTHKAKIVCFVPIISHGFSFVPWGTTCFQRKKWPFMNQFFESLYHTCIAKWVMSESSKDKIS